MPSDLVTDGLGLAATRCVVLSTLLVVISDVVLVRLIQLINMGDL
jgi:ABC-type transporter Mla maintaining outer membrane lipid asymmetry permease subunit MlaE